MPRPNRVEFANAWYHVINRAAGRKDIFVRKSHCLKFIELLREIYEKFEIEIHAYCLMTNHYHLLLRTPQANLNLGMKHLGGAFVKRYNKMEKLDGPLFKARYKAIIIDEETYLLKVSRYIHRNPVEAKMVESPRHHRWSSYGAYCASVPRPSWLNTKEILKRATSESKYQSFVENSNLPSLNKVFSSKRIPYFLGPENFVKKLRLKGNYANAWHPENRPELRSIIEQLSADSKISLNAIYNAKPGVLNVPRASAMTLAKDKYSYSLEDISKHFGVSKSTVSQTTFRFKMSQKQRNSSTTD